MEQNIVIYIGIWKALGLVAGVVVGAWYAGSRFTKVETKVEGFETRLTGLEGRLDKAFASSSPVALLPKGQVMLEDSGLKKYVDDRKEELLSMCRNKNEMKNAYDIQEAAFQFFDQFNFGDFENELKKSAYRHGVSIETIRRVAGIYFRDICLAAHNFKPEDLDQPKNI